MAAMQVVRYNARYYLDYTADIATRDAWGTLVSEPVIDPIPSGIGSYKRWLRKMREKYAKKERHFDRFVFPIYGAPTDPKPWRRAEFLQIPSELPNLHKPYVENIYIINLDREVLTVDCGTHFKLGDMPPFQRLWDLSTFSTVAWGSTVVRGVCRDDQLASLALDLPDHVTEMEYDAETVKVRCGIEDSRNRWLMRALAEVIREYDMTVHQFGREWAPESLPFREITFALLWIVSGKAKFLSFPKGLCHDRSCVGADLGTCQRPDPGSDLTFPKVGWFNRDWAGNDAPLLGFGSLFHRPGESPGVSPTETMYWFDDVLVSLVLVVDGAAVSAAITWGLQQGRSNFQLVVMTLFQVVLAEVSKSVDKSGASVPAIKVSRQLDLSPMREDQCLSTHPYEREVLEEWMNDIKAGYRSVWPKAERAKPCNYPGLAAMVNFFAVATARRSAAKSNCLLPVELCCRIIDFLDFDTWRACLEVSPAFRAYCLLKFRIDDTWRILPGLVSKPRNVEHLFSMAIENMHTGAMVRLVEIELEKGAYGCVALPYFNWMPIVGTEPRALMVNVLLNLEEVADEREVVGEGAMEA